jgi:hypothetical protein
VGIKEEKGVRWICGNKRGKWTMGKRNRGREEQRQNRRIGKGDRVHAGIGREERKTRLELSLDHTLVEFSREVPNGG